MGQSILDDEELLPPICDLCGGVIDEVDQECPVADEESFLYAHRWRSSPPEKQ